MHSLRLVLAGCAVLSLSACLLNSDVERGLAGATAGAVLGDVAGVDPLTGALIGGTAGALCDEFTRVCR